MPAKKTASLTKQKSSSEVKGKKALNPLALLGLKDKEKKDEKGKDKKDKERVRNFVGKQLSPPAP